MSNHLIHAYSDMDLDNGWTTVTGDLPML